MVINWEITKKYYFWIFVSLFGGLILKLYERQIGFSSPNNELLCSSIASILASIFALIFIILTLSIQMSGKYTSLDIIFKGETFALMFVYLFTIISSLLMLQLDVYLPIVILVLAVICILSLFPFLHSINSSILFDIGIENLSEEIAEAIDSKREATAKSKISALGALGEKAIGKKLFSKLELVLKTLEDNGDVAQKEELIRTFEEIGTQYLIIATNISRETEIKSAERILNDIKRYMSKIQKIDISVLYPQITTVIEICIKFIENDFNEKYVIILEEALFYSLMVTYKENFSEITIINLKEIAKSSHKKIDNSYIIATACLWLIGTIAFRDKNELELSQYENIEKSWYDGKTKKEIESDLRKVDKKLTSIIEEIYELEKHVGIEEFEYTFEKCKDVYILKDLLESDELELKEFEDFKKVYRSSVKE